MSEFSNNAFGEFSVENLNKAMEAFKKNKDEPILFDEHDKEKLKRIEFSIWLSKQENVPDIVIGAASLYVGMVLMIPKLAEQLQPWIDKYNTEKYCCNCDMWEGCIYDPSAKCNHNRQRGYREYTNYDMHCEGYVEKKSLLDAGLGEELRPRIDIMKEQFEFNPKEFIPKG